MSPKLTIQNDGIDRGVKNKDSHEALLIKKILKNNNPEHFVPLGGAALVATQSARSLLKALFVEIWGLLLVYAD